MTVNLYHNPEVEHSMSSDNEQDDETDSKEEIMKATFDALCKHGYARLTMQDIADEFDKSKSLLHYHYETKDDLLLAFIDWIIGWIDRQLEKADTDDPVKLLETYIDRFVIASDEDRRERFAIALFELRLQAVHNDVFRQKLSNHYEQSIVAGADIIREGIETGKFREVDANITAEAIYSALQGARMQQVMLGSERASQRMGQVLKEYLLDDLVIETQAPGSNSS